MQVLGILESGAPAGVADIQGALEARGQKLAYTTVMTVLVRLHEKGYVRRRKQGRQFLYETASKQNVGGRLLEKVRQHLFPGDRLKPILALLDESEDLSREELKELRRKIDEKLKGR